MGTGQRKARTRREARNRTNFERRAPTVEKETRSREEIEKEIQADVRATEIEYGRWKDERGWEGSTMSALWEKAQRGLRLVQFNAHMALANACGRAEDADREVDSRSSHTSHGALGGAP